MSPPQINAPILEKLLNLYFAEFPIDQHDLENVSRHLNDQGVTLLDVVQACAEILPELGSPGSPVKGCFERLTRRQQPSQYEALKAVLTIHRELQKTQKHL